MSKLYRSRRDSKLFGLCGGLAELLNVDVTLLRLVMVVTAFFSGGTVVLLYVLASLVIPKEPVIEGPFYAPRHMPPPPPPPFSGGRSSYAPNGHQPQQSASSSNLDEMMKELEKKAMQKELDELRAKLAKYEKGDK